SDTGLLVRRTEPPLDDKYDVQLSAALADAMTRHRAKSAAHGSDWAQSADFDSGGRGRPNNVPAPLPNPHGLMKLDAVEQWADLQAIVDNLRWLPSAEPYSVYRHSPEAVLAQGWGTEGDLANLTGGLLAKLGYSPALRMVKVTERGRQALAELGAIDAVSLQ